MVGIIYILVVFCATTIGAISGLGGGVIIKPLFDLVRFHNSTEIGFYSSCAVFTMSIVSLYKAIKRKDKIDYRLIVLLAIGSIVGSYVGDYLFATIKNIVNNITFIQNIVLLIVFVLLILYSLNKEKIKTFKIEKFYLIILVGVFLGMISVFLGIGGGPINLAILSLLFDVDYKKGAILSIGIIFFSQSTKLLKTFIDNQFNPFDLSYLMFIIPSAIIGGYVGSILNHRFDSNKIKKLYTICLVVLAFVSIINIFRNI